MVSDEHYELCLPILRDRMLEEEDKPDQLEALLVKETSLTGQALETVILDALWRFREGDIASASPPPIRPTILRRPSPASWRGPSTPLSSSPRLGVSPLAPPGFAHSPRMHRAKLATGVSTTSAIASPFSSPRPSPRLALATPIPIPHSPNLNAYEFASDLTPAHEILGDYQTENVDWLVSDDALSLASSPGTSSVFSSALNAAAPEFNSISTQQSDMTPYDMLRSILGQSKTDEEIEAALAANGYDLSATLMSIMESSMEGDDFDQSPEDVKCVLVGKSMNFEARPRTPLNQHRNGIICKFFMSTGQCLRADCRFSHDLTNHLCKYWVMGNCLAGETCVFSHDPAQLMNRLAFEDKKTPPTKHANLAVQDYNSFPSLHPGTPEQHANYAFTPSMSLTPPPGMKSFNPLDGSRPRSSQSTRNQREAAALALDDNEAFPSLGAGLKLGKKTMLGKKPNQGFKEVSGISSLADVVRMSPAANGNSSRPESRKMSRNNSSNGFKGGENSATALAIPEPSHIPWLETGEKANRAYLKARQEAIKHGGLRNKFLQSAAQAWNRNDARAAKALSLRGQSENELMRKAHRDAARMLYEERNKHSQKINQMEIYIDLHGLHPDEAVGYLEQVLMENMNEGRPVYAITGSGHHSKNGKDKVGRAIRSFLNDWRYAFREFSVPGDRNSMGGILGIDARSWDRSLIKDAGMGLGANHLGGSSGGGNRKGADDDLLEPTGAPRAKVEHMLSQGVEIGDGKVRLLVRDPPRGPSGRR